MLNKLILNIILPLIIILPILILCIAIYTYSERKGLASIQKRRGPNIVGFLGFGQPFADGLKLLLKEHLLPAKADKLIFITAPIIAFTFSLCSWLFIPIINFGEILQSNIALLLIFGFSSVSAYGIILAGWASNSKYSMLGTLRATAQLIAYEIVLSLTILPIIFAAKTLSLTQMVWAQEFHGWYIIPFFPSFLLFSIAAVAETNRPPFDLPEAEAELVAGYFVEYSAMSFALFFLAEYAHMLLMSHMIVVLFLGGWNILPSLLILPIFQPFYNFVFYIVKLSFSFFYFIWLRATFPRFRYDQLMQLGWKVLLPITLFWVLYSVSFLWTFGFKYGNFVPIW
jgi:NADH-quinone oxidoreductase subunit H